jgi:hypothetical protein
MSAPPKLHELVERFERNLKAYKQGNYNETEVRLEFINPLFEELGWDIANKRGYAEAYKEVVHEDAIKETGTALRGGYFRMKTAYLGPFPIRPIDFSDPSDKTRHDQMVELVEQMRDLNKQLAQAKIPQAKTVLQRQIEAADRQIDGLVYELYGLTNEEIKIVEESVR